MHSPGSVSVVDDTDLVCFAKTLRRPCTLVCACSAKSAAPSLAAQTKTFGSLALIPYHPRTPTSYLPQPLSYLLFLMPPRWCPSESHRALKRPYEHGSSILSTVASALFLHAFPQPSRLTLMTDYSRTCRLHKYAFF